jgi:hypothetical protein
MFPHAGCWLLQGLGVAWQVRPLASCSVRSVLKWRLQLPPDVLPVPPVHGRDQSVVSRPTWSKTQLRKSPLG